MEVAIIMGSDSDWNIVKEAAKILKKFDVKTEIIVASAHRTPKRVHDFVKTCDEQGVKIFIAAAGMAAHLAGVVASYTERPVIGLPIKSEPFNGLDSLLSTVQMPSGVPVATMAVNGAKNAAVFALEILALTDENISKKLHEYRREIALDVKHKSKDIQTAFAELK